VSWGAGRVDVFGRGQDNQLWQKSVNGLGDWGGWSPLGGILQAGTGPDAASNGSGKLEVFLDGQDNQLWERTFSGGVWGSFTPEGGIVTASPGAVDQTPTEIDVFVRGSDHALYWSAAGAG
jgi:hypothetical protein